MVIRARIYRPAFLACTLAAAVFASGSRVLHAQQPSPPASEEAAIIEQSHTTIRFEHDGTGRREIYVRVKVLSEAGIREWGEVVAGYNAATETVELSLIRVHKPDGSVVDTPSSVAQDLTSPVERIAPVYTDYHQKHVTVQSLRPGDTLELRIVVTMHTPLAPTQFWTEYSFNDTAVVLEEQLDIDVPSARPVTVKTKPGFEAAIDDHGARRIYHWTHAHPVRDPKPADTAPAPDRKKPAPDEREFPDVRLTTFADWAELGRWFSGLERSARVVTPELRQKAEELTKGRTSDLDKLEALYDFVSKDFRYVSLSLGLGRYQPRPAADVLRDAYGDCKDKHTLLAALIDAAGFQASAALINSAARIDPDFPSPAQFDHVITRAVIGGQVVWLDATPEVAPFRLLSAGLRAKQALVTDVEPAPRLEQTPADPPFPSRIETMIDGALDAAGALSADVKLSFRGDFELPMRMGFRLVPTANWPDAMEQFLKQSALQGKVSDPHASDPQATREPFTMSFHVEIAGAIDVAKKNVAFALPLLETGWPLESPAETDPIVIGGPSALKYSLTLKLPPAMIPRLPLPVRVARDYGTYESQYALNGTVVIASRALSITPRDLPDERRADLTSFMHVVQTDGRQTIGLDTTAFAATPPATDAAKVARSGYEALTARDYPRALELLKRATEMDPRSRAAWNNLGRAYAGLHQTDQAIAAYRKQVEVNPYDEYAYNNLGFALAGTGRYAEAEAAYQKQIEINPLDRYASGNLGSLYITTHADDKAAAVLEKAVTISPDSATLQVRLGKAYANLHQPDKARAAFARAVEIAPTPGTWNDVAYELALGGLDLDKAQQYAESAVAAVTASSRNLDIDHADAAALDVVNALASDWDTLGWVYFKKGDLGSAQRFVLSAWKLAEQAEVGDHLGQIDERQGQRDKAIAAYAQAVAADRAAQDIRQHLSHLVGEGAVEDTVAGHLGDAGKARTLTLKEPGPPGKTADFLVLFAAPDKVEAIKFISGDSAMQPLADAIRHFPTTGLFPDASPARMLRRVVAACNDHSVCAVTLIPSPDARPVK
jgi:tetratricopeptide (TPR) repeat protein/transglutaminase-like putative cysteine protease